MLTSDRLASLGGLDLPWDDARFVREIGAVVDLSDYAYGLILRHPEWLARCWGAGGLAAAGDVKDHAVRLDERLAESTDELDQMAALRHYRHQHLLRILWRDINDIDPLQTTLSAVSDLADGLIAAAFKAAGSELVARHGRPRDSQGNAVDITVLALGKLGGGELNFSSDVDLVVAYPGAGSSDGNRPLDNQEYFARQTRQAVNLLARRTDVGFVYRVDLRLRPFGDAGRLALSFAAMEEYYQREGRDWERYAWIKARPVAGDIQAGEALLLSLRPFVYRRYLDYSAFEALREMKAMIRAEVDRRQLNDDIKLGPGGIREIEFIAQAFQLIRGGREPGLRDRRLMTVLDQLAVLELLADDTVAGLKAAYEMLRRVENRLQQVSDAQTHRLPRESAARARVARALGFDDWELFDQALQHHRDLVRETFVGLFERPAVMDDSGKDRWRRIWDLAHQVDELSLALGECGFERPEAQAQQLCSFRTSVAYRSLGERARNRLGRFMPRLIQAVCDSRRPDEGLEAVMRVVRAIATRSAYVSMLSEQPLVLERLVEMCAASPWLTELVSRHPLLLDDLIDARLAVIAEPEAMSLLIRERLATVTAGDLEAEMETLRQVQQSQAMTIAVASLDQKVDSAEVARALTSLAEAILDAVYRLSWRDISARHGQPVGPKPALAIIGYGTLGGRELNFSSDLDLVFIHDGAIPGGKTDGERPLINEQFFLRTSQRMLHLLSTLTTSGRLYEVDVRLRPNGRSGFLVSALDNFETYQQQQAWTWELQALTRARPVAGDARLGHAFETVRRRVLRRVFKPHKLAVDVLDMRLKMRTELDRSDARQFDLKQGPGGKVDIEFLAQWACLTLANEHSRILDSTTTRVALEVAGELKLLSEGQVEVLLEAFDAYQRIGQHLALAVKAERLTGDEQLTVREAVQQVWSELLG